LFDLVALGEIGLGPLEPGFEAIPARAALYDDV